MSKIYKLLKINQKKEKRFNIFYNYEWKMEKPETEHDGET